MYNLLLDMSRSDKAVEYAVLILIQKNEVFGYREIAGFLGCGERVVQSSMKRLIKANKIVRVGNPRRGYKYLLGPEHEYVKVKNAPITTESRRI